MDWQPINRPWQGDLVILAQSLVALMLGGLIGWEREKAGKWAGLRTHMLVCFASMLFVALGRILIEEYSTAVEGVDLRPDPMRLTEAIVTGIAFIGAGTVFRDRRGGAQGLTTAATLLSVGPIGIAVALRHYVLAIGVTVLVFFVLRAIGHVERSLLGSDTRESHLDA
jgi:putative Mg2+ transporter-C (MgtC) family protein